MHTQTDDHHTGDEAFVLRYRNPLAKEYVIVSRVVLVGYPQLSDGAKVTYWVICSHDWYEAARRGRKGYAYPTIGRLAQLRHTTARTIQRHLAELIQAGLLTRVVQRGKPSLLYIEDPNPGEVADGEPKHQPRGDTVVRGGVTKMSPQEEIEPKQTKPVNAINGNSKAVMEEGSSTHSGWQSIKALLNCRAAPRSVTSQREWLANEIVTLTGDPNSLGCYRAIAGRCPQELVFEALALLKEARRDGSVRRSRGALFVGIIRRLCRERGLPDPFPPLGQSATVLATPGAPP